jgi:hypothetical protein
MPGRAGDGAEVADRRRSPAVAVSRGVSGRAGDGMEPGRSRGGPGRGSRPGRGLGVTVQILGRETAGQIEDDGAEQRASGLGSRGGIEQASSRTSGEGSRTRKRRRQRPEAAAESRGGRRLRQREEKSET